MFQGLRFKSKSVRLKDLEGTQSRVNEEGGGRRWGGEVGRGQAVLKDLLRGMIFNLTIMGATQSSAWRNNWVQSSLPSPPFFPSPPFSQFHSWRNQRPSSEPLPYYPSSSTHWPDVPVCELHSLEAENSPSPSLPSLQCWAHACLTDLGAFKMFTFKTSLPLAPLREQVNHSDKH